MKLLKIGRVIELLSFVIKFDCYQLHLCHHVIIVIIVNVWPT